MAKTLERYIDLADLERDEVLDLLALARRLEEHPEPTALAGKILALLFFNPSLRTLASFQSGMARLGGDSFVISPGQGTWQLETKLGAIMDGVAAEHVREAIPVLAGYADALGIRSFAGGQNLAADYAETEFMGMADVCPVPLINMESAMNHPCQALGDWKTMDDYRIPEKGKFVLTWANHPKPLPLAVPAAALHMAAFRGMEVVVLRPHVSYGLPGGLLDKAKRAAALSGGSVRESEDREEALRGAHVVYAKSWSSALHYGDAEMEKKLRAELKDWCVDESWFAGAPEAKFMHCLPVRRNVVVADEILDGPRSIVVREAHNRMWAQMAVLYRLLKG